MYTYEKHCLISVTCVCVSDGVSVTAMPLITAAKHLDCLRDDQLSVPAEVTGDSACQQQSGHNSKPK